MRKSEKLKNWGVDVANLDRRVRPQDDFFRFANGGWLKKNPIPLDESRWGSFSELAKKSRESLYEILREVAKKKTVHGSNLQKLRDYYLSGMNVKKLAKDGVKPLYPFFEMIDKIQIKDDIIRLSASLQKIGARPLWTISVDQDMKDKNIMRLYFEQGGIGLPDRDYYLKTDKKSVTIRKAYLKYMERMLRIALGQKAQVKNISVSVMSMETRMAVASMTQVERRDYEKQYNKMSLSVLTRLAPQIKWKKYFEKIGANPKEQCIVAQPLFIKEVGEMLEEISIEKWRNYLKWKVINYSAVYLSETIAVESFNFYGKMLSGAKTIKPRWQRVIAEVDGALGEALGELYIKKFFSGQAKQEINALVDNLISTYRERIKALDWMSGVTKKKALDKLHAFSRKLGYPDKWKNYKKLKIGAYSYLENHMNAHRFEFSKEIKKIGRHPDKKEWHMTPPTVNAYNNFLFNEIVFPAGIMQPPFFDPNADDAVNYGAIGAVIGHELTHGFDDKGSTFDKNGEMKNWWHKADRKLFMKRAGRLIGQYDKFEALPGVFVNGKLTIGENIADLGGLVVAYHAYQKAASGKERKIIGGFTPEQRFFLGAAQAERGHARDAYLQLQINTDPHSPSKARVNIPFSNMVEFYEAFGVKKGDKMWRPEKDRVVIW
ncbi:MAG: M13 family metallopeptidase [bacterium]|nr:M13 family metallopeptidase [bacterium]